MKNKKDLIDILIYVAIAYGLGYFGFYLWFGLDLEFAGFIAIVAPITAYLVLKKIRKNVIRVNFKNLPLKSLLLGAGLPIVYTAVTVIIYLCLKGKFSTEDFSLALLFVTILQWIFAGICEEVGWRGFLFPTLKKWNNNWLAYIVCGLIWSGWHLPMLLSNTIMTSWSHPIGLLLLCAEGILMSIIIDKLMQLTKLSIWTSIFFHGTHNIVVQTLLTMIPKESYALLDDGGILSILVLLITTIILMITVKEKK